MGYRAVWGPYHPFAAFLTWFPPLLIVRMLTFVWFFESIFKPLSRLSHILPTLLNGFCDFGEVTYLSEPDFS